MASRYFLGGHTIFEYDHVEEFSYRYTGTGPQILSPKKKEKEKYISLHWYFVLKAMFLQFNP